MEKYDPKRKEKYLNQIKFDDRIDKFLRSFQGQSEVSHEIIKLFVEKDGGWEEVNDAEYLFNHFFYRMS